LSHSNTAFHQLLKPLSRHEFEAEAKKHHIGQKLRSATRWDQFVGMAMRNCLAAKACAIFNPISKRSSINFITSVPNRLLAQRWLG
jgi:hypothetical protein